MNLGNGDHIARENIAAHGLEYFSQVFLEQSCYFVLACCFHGGKGTDFINNTLYVAVKHTIEKLQIKLI